MGRDLPHWPSALTCWPRGFIEFDLRRVMQRIRLQPQPPRLRAALKRWEEKWFPPTRETAGKAVDELLAILKGFDRCSRGHLAAAGAHMLGRRLNMLARIPFIKPIAFSGWVPFLRQQRPARCLKLGPV